MSQLLNSFITMLQSCSLCKCACPDIQTAVAFLCSRVKCPDVDDYKKTDQGGEIFMELGESTTSVGS